MPESENILKQDFLLFDETQLTKNGKIHVIGNPPFGRQSSLAKKFIKKSCRFADSISFILPKSFKKDSFQKVFANNFHLIFQQDLPKDSFEVDKISHDVPCVFQVWVKKDTNRQIPDSEEPTYYKFVKKNENPDVAVRRVGVYAGQLYLNDLTSKSNQSHYFIKLYDGIDMAQFLNGFKSLVFSSDNTVGPKSISKSELIKAFNTLNLNV